MTIFEIGFKPLEYGYWNNPPYVPLQVGFGEDFLPLRDNIGENIAEWNGVYSENTGIYWVWKHCADDIVGVCQYRRRIKVPEKAFDRYDVVVSKALTLRVPVKDQYELFHGKYDWDIVKEIIRKKYPEYIPMYGQVIERGYKLHHSNCFVMRRELFSSYCGFLFDVLGEFFKAKGWNTPQEAKRGVTREINRRARHNARGVDYQCLIGGFLSERLLTLWLAQNVPDSKILEVETILMENTPI